MEFIIGLTTSDGNKHKGAWWCQCYVAWTDEYVDSLLQSKVILSRYSWIPLPFVGPNMNRSKLPNVPYWSLLCFSSRGRDYAEILALILLESSSWAQALLSLILALWTINQFMDAPGAVPSDGNSSTLREALQLLCLLNLNARNSLCIFGIFLLFSAAFQSRAEFIMMLFFFLYVGIWEWQGLLTKGNARGHT